MNAVDVVGVDWRLIEVIEECFDTHRCGDVSSAWCSDGCCSSYPAQ